MPNEGDITSRVKYARGIQQLRAAKKLVRSHSPFASPEIRRHHRRLFAHPTDSAVLQYILREYSQTSVRQCFSESIPDSVPPDYSSISLN